MFNIKFTKNERGFSLAEVLIATLVAGVVTAASLPAARQSIKNWVAQRQKAAYRESVQGVFSYLATQFQNGTAVSYVSQSTDSSGRLDYYMEDGSTLFRIKLNGNTVQAGIPPDVVDVLDGVTSLKFVAYRFQEPNGTPLNSGGVLSGTDAEKVGSVLVKLDHESGIHEEMYLKFASYQDVSGNYYDGDANLNGDEFNVQAVSCETGARIDEYLEYFTDTSTKVRPLTPTKNPEIWVDAVNGNNAPDVSGTHHDPFQTLDFAIANCVGNGVTINLKAGTYTMSPWTLAQSNVVLHGIDQRNCIILTSTQPEISNKTGLVIENLTFQGGTNKIYLHNNDSVIVQDCFFDNASGGLGFYLHSYRDNGITVENCYYKDAAYAGAGMTGMEFQESGFGSGATLTVRNNVFVGGNRYHVYIQGNVGPAYVNGNHFESKTSAIAGRSTPNLYVASDPYGNVSISDPGASCFIEDNYFINNSYGLVFYSSVVNGVLHYVRNNVFRYNKYDMHIMFAGSTDQGLRIQKNSFLDQQLGDGNYGIQAVFYDGGPATLWIDNNYFDAYVKAADSSYEAIRIAKMYPSAPAAWMSQTHIFGNIFRNYKSSGVVFDNGNILASVADNWKCYNNVFSGMKGYCINMDDANPVIENNIFADFPAGGTAIYSTYTDVPEAYGGQRPETKIKSNYFYNADIADMDISTKIPLGGGASVNYIMIETSNGMQNGMIYAGSPGHNDNIPYNWNWNTNFCPGGPGTASRKWLSETYQTNSFKLKAINATTFRKPDTTTVALASIAIDTGSSAWAGTDSAIPPAQGVVATDMGAYGGTQEFLGTVGVASTPNRAIFAGCWDPQLGDLDPAFQEGLVSKPFVSLVSALNFARDNDKILLEDYCSGAYTESLAPVVSGLTIYGWDARSKIKWTPPGGGVPLTMVNPVTLDIRQIQFNDLVQDAVNVYYNSSQTKESNVIIAECAFNRTGGGKSPINFSNAGTAFENPKVVNLTIRDSWFQDATNVKSSIRINQTNSSIALGMNINILENTFSNNTSTLGGGAVSAVLDSNSLIYFKECEFDGNVAPNYGGALAIYGGLFGINRCIFSENVVNSGTPGSGGAIEMLGGAIGYLENCTFRANDATDGSDGVCVYGNGTTLTARNNILWNHAKYGLFKGVGSVLNLEQSIVDSANFTLDATLGNSRKDPVFLTDMGTIFEITMVSASSLAIDKGTRGTKLGSDYTGFNPDIGYFEYPGFAGNLNSYEVVPVDAQLAVADRRYTSLKNVQVYGTSSLKGTGYALYLSPDGITWNLQLEVFEDSRSNVKANINISLAGVASKSFWYCLHMVGKLANNGAGRTYNRPDVDKLRVGYGLF